MAWSDADLSRIESAITEAAVQGFAEITVGNIALKRYSLKELVALRNEVRSAIRAESRFTLASYSKD